MKLLLILSQCLLLGCSLIATIKSARDNQIEMSLAFALLSFNFMINLITTRKTTERKNEDRQFNNKIESFTDQILDVKEDSKQLQSLYKK
ncbi:hypothetical protein [Cyanothece sp. BG0011]|uniref:hypothetical protein n=2 Tax=Cyanothece sp. BG0011 TaxID=2082950 RepID=UPI0018E5A161|nr:hypothetical protein [Cyanothece sp. BG0011]